jgi:isoquinoline 1-oxidoreductase subunit beta
MADNPNPNLDEAVEKPAKKKGFKRRAFLIGGVALIGGGIFAAKMADTSARDGAIAATTKAGEASFLAWIKIAADNAVTLYSPHIDFGQGSHTALAQMLAEELDVDLAAIKVEQAPPESGFANTALGQYFLRDMTGMPGFIDSLPGSWISMIARSMPLQVTGGSSAVRATGQEAFRKIGASARLAMIEEAAEKMGVAAAELTTDAGQVVHAKSGKKMPYGALAMGAAARSLESDPPLKTAKDYKFIGKPIARIDIPAKVDGSAQYSIDKILPDMRVATIMMAPVRDGKLTSVDEKPALAVAGVEKVIKLDEAVVVVGKGYWQASKGLAMLEPKFTDGGHGALSSASIDAAQGKLNAEGEKLAAPAGGKLLNADYKAPFLHQATMEPMAMVAHYKDGKLEAWGGVQDPILTRQMLAASAEIDEEAVTFHPMIMGGGFGRRFPGYMQIIDQVARVAKQLPYPVKLIWSREQDVQHGAYRPQVAARMQAALGKDGKMAAWASDYAQMDNAGAEGNVPYTIPNFEARHHEYISNQVNAYWRSVNASQHGFFNESMVDELAHAAGKDPYAFRLAHLPKDGRHAKVLTEAAKRSGWGTALPKGTGRGIAMVESFGTIVCEVVEATTNADGSPKVLKVTAVVDCGTTVNPRNAEAQIEGGIIMGLSSAIGEAITLDKGAVQQNNFTDYPIMKLAETPEIKVHFIESGARMGGIGEPGTPPAAPALANALFAATGKRIRQLPILTQAKV